MIVRYKEWKGLFFCDDCGAVMTLTAYASEMLDTSARDRGWAIGKDHKACFCPECAERHRNVGRNGATRNAPLSKSP